MNKNIVLALLALSVSGLAGCRKARWVEVTSAKIGAYEGVAPERLLSAPNAARISIWGMLEGERATAWSFGTDTRQLKSFHYTCGSFSVQAYELKPADPQNPQDRKNPKQGESVGMTLDADCNIKLSAPGDYWGIRLKGLTAVATPDRKVMKDVDIQAYLTPFDIFRAAGGGPGDAAGR